MATIANLTVKADGSFEGTLTTLLGTIYPSPDIPEPSTKRQKSAIFSLVLSFGVRGYFTRSHSKWGHRNRRWPHGHFLVAPSLA